MEEDKELEQDLKTAGILVEKLSKVTKSKEELKQIEREKKIVFRLLIALSAVVGFIAFIYMFLAGVKYGAELAETIYEHGYNSAVSVTQ